LALALVSGTENLGKAAEDESKEWNSLDRSTTIGKQLQQPALFRRFYPAALA